MRPNLELNQIKNIFFYYFEKIFEEVFNKNNLSNKTLSYSDIKSLFRAIDNLYDICIEKNYNN